MAPTTVLVTGASGFIAAHVVDSFLRKGYHVRGTVRSEKAASDVRQTHAKYADQLTTSIVPDMAAPNAFDEAVKGVDGVIHTASPFILGASDFETELFQPAIQGTTSILEAAQKNNPAVSRVVITGSFASVVDPTEGQRAGYVYTEVDWNPVTGEAATSNGVMAYLSSKTFAEQAAWRYVQENKVTRARVSSLCSLPC
jgi:nucleoside-diphosphate-sugar epimerase